jgi:hypothetical protein
MAAGAHSIDDLDVLRHGAMPAIFGGVRAPSTLGSFLRSFTWGNVLQLGKVNRELLAELACRADLLPGAAVLAFADIDSTQRRVYRRRVRDAHAGRRGRASGRHLRFHEHRCRVPAERGDRRHRDLDTSRPHIRAERLGPWLAVNRERVRRHCLGGWQTASQATTTLAGCTECARCASLS